MEGESDCIVGGGVKNVGELVSAQWVEAGGPRSSSQSSCGEDKCTDMSWEYGADEPPPVDISTISILHRGGCPHMAQDARIQEECRSQ
jgi:hypothetical protein